MGASLEYLFVPMIVEPQYEDNKKVLKFYDDFDHSSTKTIKKDLFKKVNEILKDCEVIENVEFAGYKGVYNDEGLLIEAEDTWYDVKYFPKNILVKSLITKKILLNAKPNIVVTNKENYMIYLSYDNKINI
ncbi:hypothetical protein L3V86_09360 [Thiotrichales bacterium 19S11-10]|nr:hypothetical protein [Thiotrichales bacterium 19S11-10]